MSDEICDVENCPSYDADYETHCEGLPMGEDVKGCFTRGLSKENEGYKTLLEKAKDENESLTRIINEICDDAQRIVEEYRIEKES